MIYDERDTVFSKLMLKNMKDDSKIKKMASILEDNKNVEDDVYACDLIVKQYKKVSEDLHNEALNMKINSKKTNIKIEKATNLIKEFVRLSGIDQIGITKVEKEDLYTNRGFNKNNFEYGDKVEHKFNYAIAFAVPIELDYINRAPSKELFMGAMLAYAKGSEVAARLAMYIKSLGYDAITDCHISYESPISFLGEKAGLGQMGRCNAVVNPKYGNRTKFAAVHTNLPLNLDKQLDFGLHEFCELCRRCENNCPSKAISHDCSYDENNKKYWKHDEIACFKVWKSTGFSCGVCMSACPFSQGVDENLVSKMKDNKEIMIEIIKQHQKKYGKRNHIQKPLNFMPNTNNKRCK